MRITLHVYQSNTANTHIHCLPCQFSADCSNASMQIPRQVLRGTLQQYGLRANMFSLTMAQNLQSTWDFDLMLHG